MKSRKLKRDPILRDLFDPLEASSLANGTITKSYSDFYEDQVKTVKQRQSDYVEAEEHYWRRRHVKITNILVDLIQSHRFKKGLDIGCGEGVYTEVLSRFSDAVNAIDISRGRLEIASSHAKLKRIKNISYSPGNGMKLDFPDGVFDLILCKDVLEHLPNDYKCIRELSRVAAKGCMCILYVPNGYVLPYYFLRILGLKNFADRLFLFSDKSHGHVRSYTPDALSDKLGGTSLHLQRIIGMDWDLRPFGPKLFNRQPWLHELSFSLGSKVPRFSSAFFLVCYRM